MPPTPAASRPRAFDGLLCTLITLAVFLAARPYVEIGLLDDFSYVKTAWTFSQHHHFSYYGWATPLLLWHTLWAFPFIKLLGMSIFACRVSNTVLMLLTVLATHAVLVRGGLLRAHAFFGTLLVSLAPLTLTMGATFMTDTGGMLVLTLCLLCGMRAVQAESDNATLAWLGLGFLLGIAGGTGRQIAWLGALLTMPSAAFLVRRRRGVVALAIAGWVATVATAIGSLEWYKRQPFFQPEPLKQGPIFLHSFRDLAAAWLASLLCLVLMMLPLFPEAWRSVRLLSARTWLRVACATFAIEDFALFLMRHMNERGALPWTGDVVDRLDVFHGTGMWLPGPSPATLNYPARLALSFAVISLALLFATVLLKKLQQPQSDSPLPTAHTLSWRQILILTGPFVLGYAALLGPRGMWQQILDRYLLPLLVVFALVLLRATQQWLSPRIACASWAMLALVSLWTLCGLHDWLAGFRARTDAIARMEAAGVPRTDIRGGFEFDGMTQIEVAGTIIDPRVHYPATMDTQPHLDGIPPGCRYLFHSLTPALRQHFFLAYAQVPCLAPSRFGQVDYRGWLPPFRRTLLIEQLQP